jgi:hypothetical protein
VRGTGCARPRKATVAARRGFFSRPAVDHLPFAGHGQWEVVPRGLRLEDEVGCWEIAVIRAGRGKQAACCGRPDVEPCFGRTEETVRECSAWREVERSGSGERSGRVSEVRRNNVMCFAMPALHSFPSLVERVDRRWVAGFAGDASAVTGTLL